MRIFGCPDCANAEEETKTHVMSIKGSRNFLKVRSRFEQKPGCVDAVTTTVLATQVGEL
jgi:hypothetical protein